MSVTADKIDPPFSVEPAAPQRSPKKRRFSFREFATEDWPLIRRVIDYARPFRSIYIALMVGVLASFLTALNFAALIPVLKILLDKGQEQTKLVEIETDLAELQAARDAETSYFKRLDYWWKIQKVEMSRDWTGWIVKRREKVIYVMAPILVLAQLLKSALEFYSKNLLQKSFYMAVLRMRSELYDKSLRLDMDHLDRTTSTEIVSRLNNDIRQVRTVFTAMVGESIMAPFTVLSLLALLLVMNWRLTLIVMVGMPTIVVPIAVIGKRLRTMGKKDEEEDAKVLAFMQETIAALSIVKSFSSERREHKRFKDLSAKLAQRQIKRERFRLLGEPFVEVAASIAMALVLGVGGYIVMESNHASMEPAAFLVYIAVLTRFYPPIKRFSGDWVKLQKALGSAERIFEVIDTEAIVVEKADAANLGLFEKSIEFENVSFTYSSKKIPALDGFNLTVPKGKKVALVGEAGSGKSTAVRLLPRLYDVTGGAIKVDGFDIRDVTLGSLRRQIATVSQDTILFNDTVYNNIAYGRAEASEEEVYAAARAAHAHGFVSALPLGYQTVIGERGGQLSGGQRQRLAIARALLANTPVLILDEATSALDTQSETIVQAAIDKLMENRTVIMIAHRLSTVRKADEIIVMKGGRMIERGTHDDLIVQNGTYADMIQKAHLKA